MTLERHLNLQELTLLPSAEWLPHFEGWLIARMADGAGYWLQQGQVRDLSRGDVLVVRAGGEGLLRASRLGPLRLQFFCVQPKLLGGLLTLAECRRLETTDEAIVPQLSIHAACEPLAQGFARLTAGATGHSLMLRCGMLQLWAGVVAGLLPAGAAEGSNGCELRDRLRHLLGQMTEAELPACSLGKLATRLHCSERHLSRLFREEFGVPLRARQTELRLLRARQLLAESDAKIINVAYDSGYRHLGLFNTMFKRRFGMTPSEWRLRARKPVMDRLPRFAARAVTLLATLGLTLALSVSGQSNAPATAGAGTNSAPAAAISAQPKFQVSHFEVRGNTVLKPEILEPILAEGKGDAVSFEQIRKVLANLQNAYRERGYVTVAVSLPQQQLTNATVLVQVTEAPLTQISVVNNRYFSSNNVLRTLPSLRSNTLLNSHVFQRELDLANASRDRQIYPVIGPGPDPGTSALTLKVKDRLPLHGRFELNNQATPGTPDLRMNLSAQYNNLWDRDHQIGLQYGFTPEELKEDKRYSDTWFDDPLIANYSAFYRLPLRGVTAVQDQVEANPLAFGYSEVGHQFRLPPATGRPELSFYGSRSTDDTGPKFGPVKLVTQTAFITIRSQDSGEDVTLNEGLGSRLSWPMREWRSVRSTLSFGLDFKRYELASFNTNNFYITTVITNSSGSTNIENTVSSPQPARREAVDYLPLNVALDVSIPDKLGTTYFNAGVNFNAFSAFSDDADFRRAAHNTNASASYVTLNLGVSREQKVYHDWSVLLRANGQWADGPLISNEQFGLGGTAGVRGYREGEVYGDTGWRVLFEPRTPMVNIGMVDGDLPFWVRGSVFLDYGETYLLDAPAKTKDRTQLCGVGFGATASIGNHLDARLTIAWPLRDHGDINTGDTRVYFGLGAQF